MNAELTYRLTPEDALSLAEYHRRTSSRWQSPHVVPALLLMLAIVAVAVLVWAVAPSPIGSIAAFTLVALSPVSVFLLPFVERRVATLCKRNMAKLEPFRRSDTVCRIRITDHGIDSEIHPLCRWTDIDKLIESADYVFLFIGERLAALVPKRACDSEGRWEELVGGIRLNIPNAAYVDSRRIRIW